MFAAMTKHNHDWQDNNDSKVHSSLKGHTYTHATVCVSHPEYLI